MAKRGAGAWDGAVQASAEGEAAPVADVSGSAPAWPGGVLGCLEVIDARLTAIGQHPISDWWWTQLREFYTSGRWLLVGMIGRGGGKSDDCAKIAIAEIVCGRHVIPMGDTGVVSIVSVDRKEAGKRLKTMTSYMTALGIPHQHRIADDSIVFPADLFPNGPYTVEVKTATVAGVSGFSSILSIGDEVDKWYDKDKAANPADAVLSSLRPTMARFPDVKQILVSSPWYCGAFVREFNVGTTPTRMAVTATTWEANPSITPERCRELCKAGPAGDIEFRREYKAEPIPVTDDDGGIGVSEEQIGRARRTRIDRLPDDPCAAVFSQDRADHAFRLLVVGRRKDDAGVVRSAVYSAREWPPTLEPRPALREIAAELALYGLTGATVPDDTSTELLRIASRLSVGLTPAAVTTDMHASLRVRFADDGIEIPPHTDLAASVLAVRKRLTPEGARYDASGFAVLLALAASVASAGPADRDKPPSRVVTEARRAIAAEEEDDLAPVEDGGDWLQDLRAAAGYELQ